MVESFLKKKRALSKLCQTVFLHFFLNLKIKNHITFFPFTRSFLLNKSIIFIFNSVLYQQCNRCFDFDILNKLPRAEMLDYFSAILYIFKTVCAKNNSAAGLQSEIFLLGH